MFPLIGIGRALASRGHTVAFATNFQWHRYLEERGFERLPRGEEDGPSFHVASWGRPVPADVQVQHLEAAVETFQADLLPDNVRFVGTCLWEDKEAADPELEQWLESTGGSEASLIYVQAGRSFQLPGFWSSLVEALGDLCTRVVSSTARMEGEAGDGLPETFFCRPHVPQGRVLPHSRLAVSSGNSSAFLGALSHGVPSLLIPCGGEQPDVAALGERIGVARSLRPTEVTAAAIRSGVEELLHDENHARNARTCAEAFARVDSFEVAADLVEGLAGLTA